MTNFTVGADRQINNNSVLGLVLAKINGHSSSFNDNWQTHANGFYVGPYLGYRFSENWVLDSQLTYGLLRNTNDIRNSSGNYVSHAYSASLTATGQYYVGNFQLRPKPAIYYTYFHNSAYNLTGSTEGIGFTVPIAANNFSLGIAEMALEASRPFLSLRGYPISPYAELGVDYQYARANDGQILTGNLTMQKTSPWSGLARAGVRILIAKSIFIEIRESYLSFGQPGLRIWETRAFISYGFD